MSIKYYANKVKETSTTNGTGNFVLSGAPIGFKTFVDAIGASKKFTYYIYKTDTNFEWEIGTGYILSSGGVNQLVRERVISSTNANNLVGFTSGTKYIESIIGEDKVNTSFVNAETRSSNFIPDYISATYIVDSSSSNVQVSLPQVASESDPIILGFLLNKTIGNAYEQAGAVTLVPSGTETINGSSTSYDISILNDYLQLISLPSQSGWLKLDPIQDSTNPYGDDGAIQFKYDSAFSGTNNLVWNAANKALLIGNSGILNADNVIASSGQTTIFNQRLYDADFRVGGTGLSHLFYIDGGSNKIGIANSAPTDTLTINANNSNGIHIYKSGTGPAITFSNLSNNGIYTNNIVSSIVCSGLNSVNSPKEYARINTLTTSVVDGSESSSVSINIINNGSNEEIANFSGSGITLGFNNSNIDGTIIGSTSSNEGNNVVLGYYNNVCGENCVVIGDNSVVNSGSFGGTIGSQHTASGNNIWIFGGENVIASGNNKSFLSVDNNNYLMISNSGNLIHKTLVSNNTSFTLYNESVSSSGLSQSVKFEFNDLSGVSKTGLLISNNIDNSSISNSSTRLTANVLTNNFSTKILELSNNKLVIGQNTNSDNNFIYGQDNNVKNSGNLVFGSNINVSGLSNNIIGKQISCSGINNSIFGISNTTSNFNQNVIFGNNNETSQDDVISIGNYNSSSGLKSVACGYSNGVHGEYAVGVGSYNTIDANGSIGIGRNNNITSTDMYANIFALGIGNESSVSNTGMIVGFSNELYGSGGFVLGQNIYSSGSNNIIIGNQVYFTGANSLLFQHEFVNISGNNSISLSATNGIDVNSDINYVNCSSATGSGVANIVIQNGIIKKGDGGVRATSLTGSGITLTSVDKKYQLIDPASSGSYNINISPIHMYEGQDFYIRNTSDSLSTESISVIDTQTSSVLTTLGGISSNVSCHIVFNGTRWVLMMCGL